ncbi:hypothetical protein VOLCADRAFT_107756 [Volvox carteri f. nagariensis]|uniref:Rhodanese domain-containing protein n=1 Tax=Volvox carteri f. nagariensis TaxID=3068 RepID=D8UG46_VOLCA|nr:uncharacterized protein VOLCADRAFT_107756 [Volvox carteri f. nagariensis]EFJ41288.1 hypothetical protein VOLCADRAFT_107756 [Volvox carteri f. nagariensis]|eukprot:XP_002957622.1 hypothetical protein VOLCADRAFT_107756 [Volvox carteri f. nagariensis]
MLKAGTTITRLPTPHRGCVVVRSCAATCEASKAREQHALAVASLLASTIVTVASASPALADEAAAATVTSVAVELASTANVSVEGIDALVAPAVESEAVAIAVAPPAPQAVAAADVELAPEASTTEVAPEPAVEPVSAVLAADEPVGANAVIAAEEPIAAEEVVAAPVPTSVPVEAEAGTPAVAETASEAAADEPVAAPAEAAVEMDAGEAGPVAAVEDVLVSAQTEAVLQEETTVETVEAVEAPLTPQVVSAATDDADVKTAEAVEEAQAEIVEAPVAAALATEAVEQAAEPLVATEPVTVVAPVVAVEATQGVEEVTKVELPMVEAEEAAVPPVAAAPVAPQVEDVVPAVAAAVPEPAAVAAGGFDVRALFAGITAASTNSAEGPSAETLTYGALGVAAATFVGTFFVAPRFKEAFKEPVDWRDMYSALAARGVKTVTAEEAYAKAKKGAVILDVRLADSYGRRAAAPSTNVPLYQPIAGWDLASIIRRAGFAFFGIFGTELNESFLTEVAAKVPKNKEVIVMCETGGTIENKPGTQFGFQSRSLKALYYLQQAGYGKVLHMKGGLGDWQRAGLPLSEGASGSKGQGSSNSGGSSGAATGRGTSSGRLTATASSRNGTGSAKATTTKELVSVSSRGRK